MKIFIYGLLLLSATQGLHAQTDALPSPDQGFTQTLVMIGVALVFFYFILWRPEQKRRKTLEAQRNALKKGDRVNAMGILGTVSQIKESTVVLKMIDGSEIEFLKGAINEMVTPQEGEKK